MCLCSNVQQQQQQCTELNVWTLRKSVSEWATKLYIRLNERERNRIDSANNQLLNVSVTVWGMLATNTNTYARKLDVPKTKMEECQQQNELFSSFFLFFCSSFHGNCKMKKKKRKKLIVRLQNECTSDDSHVVVMDSIWQLADGTV